MKTSASHKQCPIQLEQVLREEREKLRPNGETAPLSALCISGGGIRSATFALGVIQGLADYGLLEQFDYLSTVSGGGYIGGWLSSWTARAGGIEKVAPRLKRDQKPPAAGEFDPIDHLREFNNYLTPKLGFFSADTWTVAATVARNILLNWLVLIPLIMAALMLPRMLLSVARLGDTFKEYFGSASAVSTSIWVVYVIPIAAAVALAYATYNMARYMPHVGGVDHTQEKYLLNVLAPVVTAALLFVAFDSLYYWGDLEVPTTLPRVILQILPPIATGWLGYLVVCGKPLKERMQLLFGPLSLAVLLMGICTAASAWFVTNYVLPPTTWPQYVSIAPPLLLLALDLGITVFVGLSSRVLADDDREWIARSSGWIELFCVCWLGACALVLLIPGGILEATYKYHTAGGLAGLSAISGWLTSRLSSASSTKPSVMMKIAKSAAPLVFVLSVAVGLSILTNVLLVKTGSVFPMISGDEVTTPAWWEHTNLLEHTPWEVVLLWGSSFFFFSWVAAHFININTFSLQGMYRNRLIRAYLGASNLNRRASRFTGFSNTDNVLMRDMRAVWKPFHVVNMALNLVSGSRLAWQQRKAQSFTVSPLHAGSFDLGYRDSSHYGGPDGISLGTAVAISGAAASPNMGYHSSPVIGFIMTLFNARLGSWLGNPGDAGDKTWKLGGPQSAVRSLVSESLGLTTNSSSYVYLSDGGHFENLALYEMVMRRVKHIVVLDGGCDPALGYEDLGNAVRKIRIDMNIPIVFEDPLIRGLKDRKKRCAVATIKYSAVDSTCEDGVLVYVKPILLSTEPPDVGSYACTSPSFPHETTGDQWFNESQTESYRILGRHTMDEICRNWRGKTVDDFTQHVAASYLSGETKSQAAAG